MFWSGGDWIELGEVSYGHDIANYEKEELKQVKNESKKESSVAIFLNTYFRNSKLVDSNADHVVGERITKINENDMIYLWFDRVFSVKIDRVD